jgi:hypothetical protein
LLTAQRVYGERDSTCFERDIDRFAVAVSRFEFVVGTRMRGAQFLDARIGRRNDHRVRALQRAPHVQIG